MGSGCFNIMFIEGLDRAGRLVLISPGIPLPVDQTQDVDADLCRPDVLGRLFYVPEEPFDVQGVDLDGFWGCIPSCAIRLRVPSMPRMPVPGHTQGRPLAGVLRPWRSERGVDFDPVCGEEVEEALDDAGAVGYSPALFPGVPAASGQGLILTWRSSV